MTYDDRETLLGIAFTLIVAGILALALHGCEAPAPADHSAPDLGECAHLSATLHDAGPVAHVVVYPDGHPCGDGGTCQAGVCE